MPDLLTALRQATRPLHDRLDSAPASARITDGTLSPGDYRALIGWQRRAHGVAEGGLAAYPWPDAYAYRERSTVLDAEARQLGLGSIRLKELRAPATLAAAVGRAYVLEGSSLGGNMILGHLRRNAAVAGLSELAFYTFQREVGAGQWRRFLAFAKTREWSEAEVAIACEEAVLVFGVFANAASVQ